MSGEAEIESLIQDLLHRKKRGRSLKPVALFPSSGFNLLLSSKAHVTNGDSPQILANLNVLVSSVNVFSFSHVISIGFGQSKVPNLASERPPWGRKQATLLRVGRSPGTLGENKVDFRFFASAPVIFWLEKKEVSFYEKSPCLRRVVL